MAILGSQGQWVSNGDARVWTTVQGEGPALLFCEGGPGLCEYIAPFDRFLASHSKLHLFHQRGVGKSSFTRPFDRDGFVSDLEAIRKHYGLDRWIVGGHSWGADLALVYATRFPERVSALIYACGLGLNPVWNKTYGENRLKRLGSDRDRYLSLREQRKTALDSERKRINDEIIELSWRTDFARPENLSKLPRNYPPQLEVNAEANADFEKIRGNAEFEQRVRKLTMPALVIHGAEDPRSSAYARELAGMIPGSRFVEVPGVGHYPWLEDSREFEQAIADFIRSVA